MNTKEIYKPTIKNFMGIADVRVIQDGRNEYVICKDIFDCLGLVDENNIWNKPKQKMLEFLDQMGKTSDWKTLPVRFKDKHSPKGQVREVDCLNIETVPIVLTQFKPTARRGKEALDRWIEFMKFVDDLLQYHELHKYIFQDKDNQKNKMQQLHEMGGKEVIANQMVNKIMGELILQDEPKFAIKKEELKIYQPKISIDLLEVRDFVMEKFANAYEFTNSHKESYDMALKLAQKKYNLKTE
jgi:hypothetical protein